MSYRKATPQETKDWLGSGLVIPALKPPPQQETNLDQVAHDKRMAQQTPAQRSAMVRGLGALARSKLGDPEEGGSNAKPT